MRHPTVATDVDVISVCLLCLSGIVHKTVKSAWLLGRVQCYIHSIVFAICCESGQRNWFIC